MSSGIAHVALNTPLFEESIRFYTQAFDAKLLGRFALPKRGCWLQLGDSILEIFEDVPCPDGSFEHIALACENVDTQYEKAISAGAVGQVEPKDIRLALETPVEARIAFVRGVSGERIELFAQKRV